MYNILDIIKDKFDNLSRKEKVLFSTGVVLGTILILRSCINDDDQNVYLVDLTDKYQNEVCLLDADGNQIDIGTSDTSKLMAMVNSQKTKKDKLYQTVVVDEKGKMTLGFMDGKFLSDKMIDKVEVNSDVLQETNVVYAPDGLWLRDDDTKKVNRDTEDAFCLPSGAYVATSDIFTTSKHNSYQWKEGIYVDGDRLKRGYLVGDYIRNTDFSKVEGKRFTVNSKAGLKLRLDSNINSDIITTLEDGSEVVLLPNVASVSDDDYDWFYVVANTEKGIKTGYAAATYYSPNGTIHYLKAKKDNSNKQEAVGEEMIFKVVDTSMDDSVPLKLRKHPGISSDIISEIEDGTKIYTYEKLIDESSKEGEVDGYKWIKVYLNNGKTGYVASQFLKDEERKINKEDSSVGMLDLDKEGNINGYFGIDIKNTVPAIEFESLINGNVNFDELNYNVSMDFSGMTKPSFVMFRIGSTYTSPSYDTATVVNENYTSIDNLRDMVAMCEEHRVPYGFYYYSQAVNDKDIEIEANFIHEVLSQIGTSDYHILPFAVDMEDYITDGQGNLKPTRVLVNAQNNGKRQQTKVMNNLMNRVRKDNNIEVISYLSKSGYVDLIDYQELDAINQENPWIVDPSPAHSNVFATEYPEIAEKAVIRQIALDGFASQNAAVDIDFVNQKYFDKLLEKNNLVKSSENKAYIR